jgi:hypothetical protein
MKSTDFIARLTFFTTDAGGLTTPVFSGYRAGIRFPFSAMQTSGRQIFMGQDSVNPGETVDSEIAIISVDLFAGKLFEGLPFDVLEGARIIGTGIIVQIVNQSLAGSASTPVQKSPFDYFTEIMGWLQIVTSPLLAASVIGAIIYFSKPGPSRLIIAIGVATIGLIIGVIWASRVWKTKGTNHYMSRIIASPELDKGENANK